jgi:glycosyltransferase involved in cell wall biosynthesis
MRIAIQAADLDHQRIDGTRVYILNMLRRFGDLSLNDEFNIYHRREFNPELIPPNFQNYHVKKVTAPFFWTQTGFASALEKDKLDVLWMPMQNIPLMRSRHLKTVTTIHDLAYKYFPKYFPKKDLFELNLLGGWAIRKSDKIIAVSESTKKDILKFYPKIKAEKIKVIYHGFDPEIYAQENDLIKEKGVRQKFGIMGNYILYTGAIQPRKNLRILISAFEIYKKNSGSNVNLVLAGEKAWLWESIEKRVKISKYANDIIMPGKIQFEDLGHLMRGASLYVYPSLYDGFGITVLEAMAARVPVICANNSSLPEVGGDAVLYFDTKNTVMLAEKIQDLLRDEALKNDLIEKGLQQIKKFSWDKCAEETLEWLRG